MYVEYKVWGGGYLTLLVYQILLYEMKFSLCMIYLLLYVVRPHPEDAGKTVMKQETVVTVQGVPLTSYMENIIVNTVSSNSNKGKAAIEWIVEKLGQECRFVYPNT